MIIFDTSLIDGTVCASPAEIQVVIISAIRLMVLKKAGLCIILVLVWPQPKSLSNGE
jgi:hypothetical protein